MKTSNISFKGTALIRGTEKQLEEIDDLIYQKSCSKSKLANFKYERIYHQTGLNDSEHKILLSTTQIDAENLTRYFDAQKVAMTNFRPNPKKNHIDPLIQMFTNIKGFYRENIKNFVTIPQTAYKAENVLKAIKKGEFNFETLEIKRYLNLIK